MATLTLHDEPRRAQWEAEDADRRWMHYQKCEGVSRRLKRERKARETAVEEVETVPATRDDLAKAIRAHAKTLELLKETARAIPAGQVRYQAVRDLVASGMRKSEVARLLGVSPQRIDQMLAAEDCPF